MIFKSEEILKQLPYYFIFLFLISCSSAKFIPTRDICLIEKHWKDNVFQVQINHKPINKDWYIHKDAMEITKRLIAKNKCMK